MDLDYLINNYIIKKLSSDDDLTNFCCGLNDMDDFLKNDALFQQEENFNVTYLVYCDNNLVGFFSLLSDNIEIRNIGDDFIIPYETCPAVKIGRLAIDKKYSNQGFGTVLLDNICGNIKLISEKLGVRFITVDAYCDVRKFYYKNKFNHFKIKNIKKLKRTAKRNEKTTIPLYKDIKRI